MKSSSIAKRYAKALFSLAVERNTQDRVLSDLRALHVSFAQEPSIQSFFESPIVNGALKLEVVKKAIESKAASSEVSQFLMLLAEKDRLAIFPDVVDAFQSEIDGANNVCRGVVRSTTALAPPERLQIEKTVESVLKKKVIMTYKVDPSVIGGLVAQVGSHTFDDSLSAHLKRMGEELRRTF